MNGFIMDRVIYVAGKYRDKTEIGVYNNIQLARLSAIRLWKLGWVVICPHLNTSFMGGIVSDEFFIESDLELLSRSDAIFMLDNWEDSPGANKEHALAQELGIRIFYQKDGYPV